MAALPVPPMPVPVPEPAPLSEGARLLNVFIAPSKTFADLRRNASWWGPFVLFVVMAAAFTYAVGAKIGFRQIVENQIQHSPKAEQRMEQMPPADRDQAIERQAAGTRYFMYGFPVVLLVLFVILSAIYLVSFKFGANADLNFKVTFAVVIYASLPDLIRQVLALISVYAGAAPDTFNVQNPVATNLGYFLEPANSPFLYGVASALDIFRLWALVLTAIGFAYAGKVKQSTAFTIVFGWFVVLTLVFSGLGALAS